MSTAEERDWKTELITLSMVGDMSLVPPQHVPEMEQIRDEIWQLKGWKELVEIVKEFITVEEARFMVENFEVIRTYTGFNNRIELAMREKVTLQDVNLDNFLEATAAISAGSERLLQMRKDVPSPSPPH